MAHTAKAFLDRAATYESNESCDADEPALQILRNAGAANIARTKELEAPARTMLYFTSGDIETHPCLKCRAPMVLTCISTARLDFDVRTFECFNCDNVDKVMIETKRRSTLSA